MMKSLNKTGARPLRILMISSEVESLARTGGLGDVVESLSRTLATRGAEVLVVTPLYNVTKVPARTVRWERPIPVRVGWGPGDVRSCNVVEVEAEADGARSARPSSRLRVCLLEEPSLFGRDGLYGDRAGTFADNDLRFATLSRGALEIAARVWPDTGGPDVIHAHDWHAALSVVYAKSVMGDAWRARPAVFTIHNLAFQGLLDPTALDRLGIPRALFEGGALDHFGAVNLLKGALTLSDAVTTVSPTYAREILTPEGGFGLDVTLREQRGKLSGILNGIDVESFDPSRDAILAKRYGDVSFAEGRAECKRELARLCGLQGGEGPVLATVTRLSQQKGMDLLLDLVPFLVDHGARVVLVGQGDAALEERVRGAAERFPRRVASKIVFDPDLARRVYAGADFFAVPSRYEPCGLTQMYAMRYGALPVVTAVGGLRDTVEPIDVLRGTGTGFVAAAPTTQDLLIALHDALDLARDPVGMREAVGRAMRRDSSWGPQADAYLALYQSLL